MRSWVRKHEFLAKAIACGGISLLAFTMGIIPSWQKIGELNGKIESRKKEERALTEKVRVLSNLNLQLLEERLEIIDKSLPPKKDVVLYLSTVDGLSRELGLSFAGLSLSPGDVTEATESAGQTRKSKVQLVDGVETLETEIKINGGKESIYEFLKTLENTRPLMQVKDVAVSPVGTGGSDSYSLNLRLAMLWAARNVQDVKGAVTLFSDKEEEYFTQLSLLRSFDTQYLLQLENDDGLGKFDLFSPDLTPQQSASPQESLL